MKYSIIIPVYNAEQTLKRCLDSLLAAVDHFAQAEICELILINDGSGDSSPEICGGYAAQYSFIRFFSQQNSGPAAARNKGIDLAKGEYVLFVDSDDYVSEDMFAVLEDSLRDGDYDYVLFSMVTTDGKKEKYSPLGNFCTFEERQTLDKVSQLICNKAINPPMAKLYKNRILSSAAVRFPDGCNIAEDRAFNILYALHIHSINVSEKAFYYYSVENSNSLSRKVRSAEELSENFSIAEKAIQAGLQKAEVSEKKRDAFRRALNFCSCRAVYSNAKRMKLRGASSKDVLIGIRKDVREMNRKKLKYPKTAFCFLISMPVKLRLCWLVYLISARLAKR